MNQSTSHPKTESSKSALAYVIISLGSKTSDRRLDLEYQIFNHPLMQRWLIQLKKAIGNPKIKIRNGGHFEGKVFLSETTVFEQMCEAVEIVNNFAPGTISRMPNLPFDREYLNYLHGEFERLNPILSDSKTRLPDKVRCALLDINMHVHSAENFTVEDQGPRINIDFTPNEQLPLEREDLSLFEMGNRFGYLYHTYGITGVSPYEAFLNRPKRTPVPQWCYCAGFFLSFRADQPFLRKKELAYYLKNQFNMDVSDPKITLGYIPLGKLVFPKILNWIEANTLLKDFNQILNIKIASRKRELNKPISIPGPCP